jgi:carbamoyltransferase
VKIVGISAYYHDSAACLVIDGELVAAAQEERFTRKKHDAAFPTNALRYCIDAGGLRPSQVDHVAFYDKPFPKFERILETYLAFAPRGFASFAASLPVWTKEKLFQKALIVKALAHELGTGVDWSSRLLFSEHHLSHAASAFFPSPFEEAAWLR